MILSIFTLLILLLAPEKPEFDGHFVAGPGENREAVSNAVIKVAYARKITPDRHCPRTNDQLNHAADPIDQKDTAAFFAGGQDHDWWKVHSLLPKNPARIIMLNKYVLAAIAALFCLSGTAHAQFEVFSPSDFGLSLGEQNVDGSLDISSTFGAAAGSVELVVSNGFVNANNDTWTVAENNDTTWTINSIFGVRGLVQHGANLGSDTGTSGSDSQDGLIANDGVEWSRVLPIDIDDYEDGRIGDTFFVDYSGPDTGVTESNSNAFRWTSDEPVTSFTVFTNNTLQFNNNYVVGVVVPEPTSLALIALATGLVGIRRKRI